MNTIALLIKVDRYAITPSSSSIHAIESVQTLSTFDY
jgi:hypothetical protein